MKICRHPVIHQPPIECDTAKTIAEYVSAVPCMLIAAYRSDLSREENTERNERLEALEDALWETYCMLDNGEYKSETELIKDVQERLLKTILRY